MAPGYANMNDLVIVQTTQVYSVFLFPERANCRAYCATFWSTCLGPNTRVSLSGAFVWQLADKACTHRLLKWFVWLGLLLFCVQLRRAIQLQGLGSTNRRSLCRCYFV